MRRLSRLCRNWVVVCVPFLLAVPALAKPLTHTESTTAVCTVTATPVGTTTQVHFVAVVTGCPSCENFVWDFGD